MPFDVAAVTDPGLRRLHDCWRAKAGARPWPKMPTDREERDLLVPLSADGQHANMILGGIYFRRPD